MSSSSELDLANCDKEPIHQIGGIQSHGFFIAFGPKDKVIAHASTNIENLTGIKIENIIDKNLSEVFSPAISQKIETASAQLRPEDFEYLRLRDLPHAKLCYEALIYQIDGLIAVEFEEYAGPDADEATAAVSSLKRSRSYIEDLHLCQTLGEASKMVCRAVREMIGYDRVMMYRYLPNWDGEVIAEDKTPEAHSFLHHRFPASDIPLPARLLYLKNRTRQIVDSSAGVAAIVPNDHYLTRKPIDLSHSKLRAVSPIHLEYLKNMGVKASFSVALITEGRLWGLIACHGRDAGVIPHDTRLSCETLASTFAIMANMLEATAIKNAQIELDEKLRQLFTRLHRNENPFSALFKNHTMLEDIFSAVGTAFVTKTQAEIAGLAPPQSLTLELAEDFRARFIEEQKTVLAVDSLTSMDAKWRDLIDISCGVLAIYLPSSDSVFMIFRPEHLRTVTWGGDPRKKMEKRQYPGQLNPRLSFESWTETVNGHSMPWSQYEIKGAHFLREFVFENLISKTQMIKELGDRLLSET